MLINPVNFRLSISIFWNSTWSFYKNSSYKYLFYSDLIFFEFFMFFFRKILNLKFVDYYPSHIRLYRLNNKIIINLYYHISKEDHYLSKIELFKQYLKKEGKKEKKEKEKQVNEKKILIKYIKKVLLRFFFNNIIIKKKDFFNFLHLKWKYIKKYSNLLKKNLLKKLFLIIGKKYLYFFINKKNTNMKKKKKKKKSFSRFFFLNFNYKKNLKEKIFYKIKYDYFFINNYKKINIINNNILKIDWKKKKKVVISKDFYFLYKINLFKFIYNQKLWIFNIYYYFLSKNLKNINKLYFFKYFKKFDINIYQINKNIVKSNIISKYITTSLKNNYNIYETMRPILVDLKEYIIRKRIAGFKIAVSGRFKRVQRATYWWRKDGHLLTGTQTFGIDYNASLHKTKYGISSIHVWLAYDLRGFDQLKHEYPIFYPFFFLIKKKKINYFILKKNNWFFFNLLKKNQFVYFNIKFDYIKNLILNLIYKYIYTYIFIKNVGISCHIKGINKYLKKIFLPQYCIYKIFLENYLNNNNIKIFPFINLKLLKRINLRNSYKIKFLQVNKLINLQNFKYKIYLS